MTVPMRWRRTTERVVAIGILLATIATYGQGTASAAPADKFQPPKAAEVKSVPVAPVQAGQPAPAAAPADASRAPAPVWPVAGEAEVALPTAAGDRRVPATGGVRAGTLPVLVDRPETAPANQRLGRAAADPPERVRVRLLDRADAAKAGIRGLLMRVSRADGAGSVGTADGAGSVGRTGTPGSADGAGSVAVTVDYRSFATAYGADWGSRLRLVELPECALTTPERPECAAVPLPSRNDLANRRVTAQTPATPQGALVGLMAGPAGAAGDYAATDLKPSATWTAGGNSGDFTWTYPLRTPPGLEGPTPQLNLGYSAQSVDGRHAASNNQPSWVGEGFEFSPGDFIERRYRSCAQDMDGPDHNNSTKTGDLCWETENATMSLGGRGGELLYDADDGYWHLRRDDGTRAEKIVGGSSYGNGDNNGEYWKVTTADGTRYYFGRHKLDGWTSGKPVTNSTWTVPVFGNDPGEPCRGSSFANSDCVQAWRWNLDYVVDPHGNTMSFWYKKETNRYARNNSVSDLAQYVRGGYLDRIEYGTDNRTTVDGTRTDSLYRGVAAPMRVEFTEADRCLSNCDTHNAVRWPDTPWDQQCTAEPCLVGSPTFWSTKRLASVTTQLRDGSGYRNVERWTFTHTFPDPGDGTRAGLWLSKISHEGLVGTATSMPDVEFTGVQLNNRVDTIDHSAAMNWWRIARIRTEAGGAISITYSAPDCVAGSRIPTSPQNNSLRCYPVRWTPEGYPSPIIDYFHKYVVKTIFEVDHTGGVPPNGSPHVAYHYDYLGDPAWHYADDDGLVAKKDKTWSVWRGYARVGVTIGDPGEQTYTETTYFRGMHGDKLPSGTRSVQVTGTGVPTVNDEDAYAGMERETITFNGPDGPVVGRTVSEPWQSAPTASRTINGSTVHARYVNVAASHERTTLDAGRGDRVTTTRTSYDGYGQPVQVEELGDVASSGDEKCVKTVYEPRNTSAWLLSLAHQVNTYATTCAAAADPTTLGDDDVISVQRTSYDGAEPGVAPTRGDVTRAEEMSAWNAGAPTFTTTTRAGYDAYGRVIEGWDAMDKRTTMSFVPATGGPVTRTVVTNPLSHTVTTDIEPAWGNRLVVTDANGKVTRFRYDGLGRLTGIWLPGRDTSDPANITHSYSIRTNAASSVTTKQLNPAGGYVTTHTLYDGLLRERQTQAPSPNGGRLLTDIFYDSAGRNVKTYAAYYNTSAPGTTLVTSTDRTHVPNQTRIEYDGAGRAVAEIFQPYDAERWRTKTYYAGDRVDVTPPAGGTVSGTVTDALGRVVAKRQYRGSTPTGAFDATSYTYDRKGQLTRFTDHAGNAWTYEYDLRGRQVKVDDPDKGETTTTYNNADKVTSTTDSRGTKLVYTYDSLGRRTAIYENAVSGLGRARWTYDTVAKGQLTQSTRYEGTNAYTVKVDGYTDDYQPTSRTVTIPSAEAGLGGTYTFENTYHVDGSVSASSFPASGDLPTETVFPRYDPVSGLPKQLTTIYGTTQLSYVADTDYNALGNIDQIELYTGLYSETGDRVYQSFERELETGRLLGSRTDREAVAPHTVTNLRYSYDDTGNVTKVSDLAAAGGPDHQCFSYDHLRRLTEAWTPGSGDCAVTPTVAGLGGPARYWLSWSYTLGGNREKQVEHLATGDRETTYQYPAAGADQPHALTATSTTVGGVTTAESYTYDSAGNTLTRPTASAGTQTLTWDPEGRVATSVDNTGTTSYLYDADGNRLIARDPKGKTLYLPGQEVRFTTSTATRTCTRFYSFAGQTIASRTATGLTWLSSDHQGTTNVAVKESGQQADVRRQTPFGVPRGDNPVWPNSKGFVGGTVDGTGLTHLGAREYDPATGRFVSVDPLFSDEDPQQTDGYSYARHSPVSASDPDGLAARDGYVWIGGRKWSEKRNGYRYTYSVDWFLRCRYSGGTWCLGGIGNTLYWVNMAYANRIPGLWFVVYEFWQVTKVALNFIGPVAPPRRPSIPTFTAPACPTPPKPEPTAEKKPKCDFWQVKCLRDNPKTWWDSNKDWVTGGAAAAGMAACIFFTAGVCGAVGMVGLGVAAGGRTYDFVNDGHYKTADGWARYGGGLTIDLAATRIPGVRNYGKFKSQMTLNGAFDAKAGTKAFATGSGQAAWFTISAPSSAPWQQMGPEPVVLTDPFKW